MERQGLVWRGKEDTTLTETKVAGKKIRVRIATVRIAVLSLRTASLIRIDAWLSRWVARLNA